MIERVIKRDGSVAPFDKSKIVFAVLRAAVAVGGRNRELAERIADKVVAYLEEEGRGGPEVDRSVEEIQDAVEKILIEEGHARTAKAYIVYRYEHALKRKGRDSLTYSSENIPYRKLWETLSWAVDNLCCTLAQMRDYVSEGRFDELVERSEAFYEREIAAPISDIRDRLDKLRVIIMAGPSSSGKTTSTRKIAEALESAGKRMVPIEVDNYFFDLHTHPTDSYGDYDFETPQALDMELLNWNLADLVAGKTVEIPSYNFKTGRREGISEQLTLGPDDILLIDSLHGLYEPMTRSVPEAKKYKIYIETLAQIKDDEGLFVRWTDIRMMRRMVRDMQFRNYNPRETLLHWYLVRRAELRHIISRINTADIVVNSFLPSELPIMKRRLAHLFPDFIAEVANDPNRRDAYDRAVRINAMLSQVPNIDAEDAIPPGSLLREFIGGSIYVK
jgi:uridine kinase